MNSAEDSSRSLLASVGCRGTKEAHLGDVTWMEMRSDSGSDSSWTEKERVEDMTRRRCAKKDAAVYVLGPCCFYTADIYAEQSLRCVTKTSG